MHCYERLIQEDSNVLKGDWLHRIDQEKEHSPEYIHSYLCIILRYKELVWYLVGWGEFYPKQIGISSSKRILLYLVSLSSHFDIIGDGPQVDLAISQRVRKF
jgi:hypothetical protein